MCADSSHSMTPFAIYPLSLVDNAADGVCLIKEWLVEGLIDVERLRSALNRVISKWPLLSGRIIEIEKRRWAVRTPLAEMTYSTSPLPLSHFIEINPISTVAKVPPPHLFVPPERYSLGGSLADFAKDPNAPITHWHVTWFKEPDAKYSCIGVHFPHGVFDGCGFATIIHAVAAELSGEEWVAPPLPKAGLNDNRFITLITEDMSKTRAAPRVPFVQWPIVGVQGLLAAALKLKWKTWRYGDVDFWNLVIPHMTHTKLVANTRESLGQAGVTGVHISAGDVIAAWFIKTIFKDVTDTNRVIGINNIASLRSLWGGELSQYPHNCFGALPYPTMTVGEATTLPLWEIALKLARVREASRLPDATAAYAAFQELDARRPFAFVLEFRLKPAQEQLMFSNVSAARIADINWQGAGAGRAICHWQYYANTKLLLTGSVAINGRMGNGDLVITTVMNRKSAVLLGEEIDMLTQELGC